MKIVFFPWSIFAACILGGAMIYPQVGTAGDRATLDEFLELRAELLEERRELAASNAHGSLEERMKVMYEWRERAADRFERMRELSDEVVDERPSHLPIVRERELPADLSGEIRELLELRWQLTDERTELERKLAGAPAEERMEAISSWREKRAVDFERLREVAQSAAASRSMPEAPRFEEPPESLSPATRDFLRLRQELVIERYELEKLYSGLSAEDRLMAYRQWREDRAEAFEKLRELAVRAGER